MSSTVKIEVAVKVEASEKGSQSLLTSFPSQDLDIALASLSQDNTTNHKKKHVKKASVVQNAGVRKRENNRITHPPEHWQALSEWLENMPEQRVSRQRADLKKHLEAKAIVFLQRTPPSPRGARCHASVCVCGEVAGHQQIFSNFRISIESWPRLGRFHVECFENIMPIPELIPETFCLDTRSTLLSHQYTMVQGPSFLFAWMARKGVITISEYVKHREVYDDVFEYWTWSGTNKAYECPPKPADPQEALRNGKPETCLLSDVLSFIKND
ncbi:MAG: hypothetical protein Q9187_003407, partial [Circinaria calcarea]